jgi:type VI protein secretion system component VasF
MSEALGHAPRQTRETLRAFQRLSAALSEIARRADAEAGTDPAEQARAAAAALRRLLVELGAPETPPARGTETVDRGYVLACYADEALLRMIRWGGAPVWQGFLLERALYGAELAGERLVAAAERMVALRDPARRDVAAALFLAFAAGFPLGPRHGARSAARLKAALYDLAMDRPPPERLDLRRRFALTAGRVIAAPRRPRPQPVRRAAAALGLVLAGYLVAAHVVWTLTHAPVGRLADRVVAQAQGGGGS